MYNAEQILSLLYEPLFSIDEKGKLELAAAKEYEVDKEKREIAITLRESYWSDNLKVKYQDAHLRRLNEEHCETRAGMMFVNTLIDFERVGDHAKNIAFSVSKKPTEKVSFDENLVESY